MVAKPGRHADGDGLYLIVDSSGAKRWQFLFRWRGEAAAFYAGVRSVLRIASAGAAAFERMPNYKPGRAGFASAALRELAEAGRDLLLLPDATSLCSEDHAEMVHP
jgi:hypothetical protein